MARATYKTTGKKRSDQTTGKEIIVALIMGSKTNSTKTLTTKSLGATSQTQTTFFNLKEIRTEKTALMMRRQEINHNKTIPTKLASCVKDSVRNNVSKKREP